MRYAYFILIASCAFAQGWTAASGTNYGSACPPNGFGYSVCPSSQPGCTLPLTSGALTMTNYSFSSLCGDVTANAGGGIADTRRNRLIFSGGGHGGYNGNEWYGYDVAAGVIKRLSDPSVYDNASGNAQLNPDGTIPARHTVGGIVYVPDTDQIWNYSGIFQGGGAGNHMFLIDLHETASPDSTVTIQPSDWHDVSVLNPGSPFGVFGTWDSRSKKVIYRYQVYMFAFDPIPTQHAVVSCTASTSPTTCRIPDHQISLLAGTTKWTITFTGATGNWTGLNTGYLATVVDNNTITIPLNSSGFGALTGTVTGSTYGSSAQLTPQFCSGGTSPLTCNSGYSSGIAVDPDKNIAMMIGTTSPSGGGNLAMWRFDMSDYSVTDMTATATGCSALNVPGPALNWDPSIGRFVAYPNDGNTAYIYDVTSNTCSPVTFSGGPPASGLVAPNGTYGRFAYFPALGKYAICNKSTNNCYTFTLRYSAKHGLGSSTITCLDKDGDGYGVGPGCTGPDADDLDATVYTAAHAISKYGDIPTFIKYLGYNPTNICYLATTGNDGTAAANDASLPYATWAAARTACGGGSMVMVRGGTWNNLTVAPAGGSAGAPVIYLAYPGERPVIDNNVSGSTVFNITDRSYLIFDGITVKNGTVQCFAGGTSAATGSPAFTNIIWRNMESESCTQGIIATNGDKSLVIEDSLWHDIFTPGGQHCLYLGARGIPSSDIVVRRNICYNALYNGIHLNGRMSNVTVRQLLVYNFDIAGISMQMGVNHSYFSDIACMTTGSSACLEITDYLGDCAAQGTGTGNICAYDQNYNVFEGVTNYGALNDWHGVNKGASGGGRLYATTNTSANTSADLGHNRFANMVTAHSGHFNGVGTSGYPSMTFAHTQPTCNSTCMGWIASDVFLGITFAFTENANGDSLIGAGAGASYGYAGYSCASAPAIAALVSSCSHADPAFVAASAAYWNAPTSYDLRLRSTSPAFGAGVSPRSVFDLVGNIRSLTAPNLGAFAAPPAPAPPAGIMLLRGTFRGSFR